MYLCVFVFMYVCLCVARWWTNKIESIIVDKWCQETNDILHLKVSLPRVGRTSFPWPYQDVRFYTSPRLFYLVFASPCLFEKNVVRSSRFMPRKENSIYSDKDRLSLAQLSRHQPPFSWFSCTAHNTREHFANC